MTPAFDNLFTKSVLGHLAQQLGLLRQVGSAQWNCDIDTGTLSFGENRKWCFQILGTESNSTSTWLWAWANIASNFPAHLLAASHAIKAFGEMHEISELTEAEIPLSQVDGYAISVIASGIYQANASYRCQSDSGALVVLITDEQFPLPTTPLHQRIATVFPLAISCLRVPDHKLALTSYLDREGAGYEQSRNQVILRNNGEVALAATFDEQNRLTKLETTLKPQKIAVSGETWGEFQLRLMLGR